MTQIPLPSLFDLPSRAKTLAVLETLAIGAAGGGLFVGLHLPGGLISGAMLAVGAAAMAGRPLTVPPILTQTVLVVLGISLGSVVSRQLVQQVSAYPLTIALLALATFCATFGSSIYLQRVHGWDRTSAFLAGSPGALSQITILAVEKGADLPAIAVVQTLARDRSHRGAAAAAGAQRDRAGRGAVVRDHDRLAARTRRTGRGRAGRGAAAAAGEVSGELDVRRDARLRPAARRRPGRGRPAELGARRGAGRHRRPDRKPFRADADEDAARTPQRGAGLVRDRDRDFRGLRRRSRCC